MIEASLQRQLSRLLGPKLGADQKIELDRSLAEHYGLTSMKMVLLVTALCEDTGRAGSGGDANAAPGHRHFRTASPRREQLK